MFAACDPEMFAGLILMLNERFWSESLQIEPPRLVLNGDQEVTPDWVARASLALPNTEIVLLPGKGHICGFLACEEAVAAARDFLDRFTDGTAAAWPSQCSAESACMTSSGTEAVCPCTPLRRQA